MKIGTWRRVVNMKIGTLRELFFEARLNSTKSLPQTSKAARWLLWVGT